MTINNIRHEFMTKVGSKIKLIEEGEDRFRILSPFQFDDGDQLVIVLKKVGDKWVLSDERHTFRHMTYEMDEKQLFKGARRQIIENALSMFDIINRNGELWLDVSDGNFGDAFFDFVQSILKITDISYLSKVQTRSPFMQEFHNLLLNHVGDDNTDFEWFDSEIDKKGIYKVDCKIESAQKPIFAYAINNDRKIRDVTIALHQFNAWGLKYRPLGIFEGRKKPGVNVLERFVHVCDEYFIGINESYASILDYIDTYS